MNDEDPTLFDDDAITVIKVQYCYQSHRFDEPEVLAYIHADEEIPGTSLIRKI